MTLKLLSKLHCVLTIPAATMRAGYPGWEPHLHRPPHLWRSERGPDH